MADPLTQTVEQFAPAPLNIFDQKQAETVMSRYAGAQRNLQSAKESSEAIRQAQQARRDELMNQRQQILNTREDEDYRMKKEAEKGRSEFLADAMETLKPKQEGYYEREFEFLKNAPVSIQKDPITRELLNGLKAVADRSEKEREANRTMQERNRLSLVAFEEKKKYDKLLGNLSQEDWEGLPKGEDGQPLPTAATRLALQREREAKEKEAELEKERQKDLIDYRGMSAEQKKADDDLKNVIIQDSSAFPRRETLVLKKAAAAGKSPKSESVKRDLASAKEWDKNIFEKEILAARDFDKAEDYINLLDKTYADMGIEMPDSAKQNRRLLWDYAQKYKPAQSGVAAPALATPAAPARTVTKQYVEGDYAVREYSDGSKQRKKLEQ